MSSLLVIESPAGAFSSQCKPGDRDPGVGRGAAYLGNLCTREAGRIVANRERRKLNAVIAERGGKRALLRERQFGDHLVAERDAHRSAARRRALALAIPVDGRPARATAR